MFIWYATSCGWYCLFVDVHMVSSTVWLGIPHEHFVCHADLHTVFGCASGHVVDLLCIRRDWLIVSCRRENGYVSCRSLLLIRVSQMRYREVLKWLRRIPLFIKYCIQVIKSYCTQVISNWHSLYNHRSVIKYYQNGFSFSYTKMLLSCNTELPITCYSYDLSMFKL